MKGQQAKVFGGPWNPGAALAGTREATVPEGVDSASSAGAGPGPPGASGAEHSLTHLLRFLTHSSYDGMGRTLCGVGYSVLGQVLGLQWKSSIVPTSP